ncbi:MAG TPA: bifunctional phosphopantothenoylcysteine decarboxylase/phosphopantothenate--cysteine ligase CoaBC [Microthrixaceae bacterium]|nr:bifunctional phosphopantothenoylcysteine decarboxylase/phosphopantothenate--cysteine ligase CoaBC [Microthrixaceae bacterium]HMT24482.1 bifunctional phosphopantothenoylcysteine decarboxylase/phosphopantothenate--cysteine ligase CoaBC [Microthrixaceae bacterium]HMT62251.1 bifunctional phosphopantothenoylcysteine decarboxylase/phosphopantothenate--cysteine ligase CoaBC [Microthrixaceae bacterium]
MVLGVTGGIAAYKAVEVCRRLVDDGAFVSPVLTDGALRFVGATTFSALASEPVRTELWDAADPIPHTRLGQGADVIVVAPATARLLSDYASGRSADLLTATLIATEAPVVVCPAMHTEMWEHPAVQENVATLRRRGVHIVDPEQGRLAGGDLGTGRLAAPEAIVAAVRAALAAPDLEGLQVVVTAGGTREALDPVRYLGNRSSGRQGHAIAQAAAERGGDVTLVTAAGLATPPGVRRVDVESAQQMYDSVLALAASADIVVMAAAVADFRPVVVCAEKLKKRDGVPTVQLEPTPDILAALGATKRPGQTIVGFAAETQDVATNALDKLARKGADLIVANDVSAPGVGFEHETNQVTVLGADGHRVEIPLASKRAIARRVIDEVVALRTSHTRETTP